MRCRLVRAELGFGIKHTCALLPADIKRNARLGENLRGGLFDMVQSSRLCVFELCGVGSNIGAALFSTISIMMRLNALLLILCFGYGILRNKSADVLENV